MVEWPDCVQVWFQLRIALGGARWVVYVQGWTYSSASNKFMKLENFSSKFYLHDQLTATYLIILLMYYIIDIYWEVNYDIHVTGLAIVTGARIIPRRRRFKGRYKNMNVATRGIYRGKKMQNRDQSEMTNNMREMSVSHISVVTRAHDSSNELLSIP